MNRYTRLIGIESFYTMKRPVLFCVGTERLRKKTNDHGKKYVY